MILRAPVSTLRATTSTRCTQGPVARVVQPQQRLVATRSLHLGFKSPKFRMGMRVSAAASSSEQDDDVPANCRRYKVSLIKPLGLVLEEKKNGEIYVAGVTPDSSADKCGEIGIGDVLISTSAITFTTKQDYGEITVGGGEQRITMNVKGEKFETVMAAIGTHRGLIKVGMEFQRCDENMKNGA
eukprot:CAMPEP_0198210884 /NCGR_PEP_ID=MMETSP1445-20131203/22499_1 /TAXON_ID=36898 /ORGANISM="Pyramimonas sp., Strain CCMP2087" /LENGTH=183 /DNA_ID=CAMNT_0043885043 /DNA_START=82 /DNA_END=633 /DNA_ORIENTATION=-